MSFSVRAGVSGTRAERAAGGSFRGPEGHAGNPQLCFASASLGSCDFPPLGVTPCQGGTGSGWCGGE